MNIKDIFLNYHDNLSLLGVYKINYKEYEITFNGESYKGDYLFHIKNNETLVIVFYETEINMDENKFLCEVGIPKLLTYNDFRDIINYVYSIPAKKLSEKLSIKESSNLDKKFKI